MTLIHNSLILSLAIMIMTVFSEIYVFTHKGDSLFLNVNEFFEPLGTRLERVYITKIGVVNNIVTSIVYPAGFFDNDGDGNLNFILVSIQVLALNRDVFTILIC